MVCSVEPSGTDGWGIVNLKKLAIAPPSMPEGTIIIGDTVTHRYVCDFLVSQYQPRPRFKHGLWVSLLTRRVWPQVHLYLTCQGNPWFLNTRREAIWWLYWREEQPLQLSYSAQIYTPDWLMWAERPHTQSTVDTYVEFDRRSVCFSFHYSLGTYETNIMISSFGQY